MNTHHIPSTVIKNKKAQTKEFKNQDVYKNFNVRNYNTTIQPQITHRQILLIHSLQYMQYIISDST